MGDGVNVFCKGKRMGIKGSEAIRCTADNYAVACGIPSEQRAAFMLGFMQGVGWATESETGKLATGVGREATLEIRLTESPEAEGIPIVDDARDSNPRVLGKLVVSNDVGNNPLGMMKAGVSVKLFPAWKTVEGQKTLRCLEFGLS